MGFCDDIREIRQKCFLSQEAFAKGITAEYVLFCTHKSQQMGIRQNETHI